VSRDYRLYIDDRIIWEAIQNDLPILLAALERIAEAER
jgi:uncharacterized protein with HEPN domain